MIALSPKLKDVADKQRELIDWLRAGGKLTPVLETMETWALPKLKASMTETDTAAVKKGATAVDHHALIMATVMYRDSLHAMAGRQEIKGAAVRRPIRHLTVLTADFAALKAGSAYV